MPSRTHQSKQKGILFLHIATNKKGVCWYQWTRVHFRWGPCGQTVLFNTGILRHAKRKQEREKGKRLCQVKPAEVGKGKKKNQKKTDRKQCFKGDEWGKKRQEKHLKSCCR
jgi:hypothetical protein